MKEHPPLTFWVEGPTMDLMLAAAGDVIDGLGDPYRGGKWSMETRSPDGCSHPLPGMTLVEGPAYVDSEGWIYREGPNPWRAKITVSGCPAT